MPSGKNTDGVQRKILLGFDPEHGGADVIRLGRLMAEVLAAQPLVVAALPWPQYLMGIEDMQKYLDIEMRDEFTKVREQLAGLDCETLAIASHSPASALYELAEAEPAEMIVLGSCHRGPVGRTLAGSVGESLMHGAPCAIAIAPRGYSDHTGEHLLRVGVAFDGSPEAWGALETAIGVAERCHAQVTVITVADYPKYTHATSLALLARGEVRDREQEEKQSLLELAAKRVPAGLESESRVLTGEAGSLLSKVSAEFDLLVTGSRAYGPLRRTLLGSTTRKLIRSAACPVLVLPRAVGVDPLHLRVRRSTSTPGVVKVGGGARAR